ncbi:PA14 domain-containing protein [Mesonia sp.]|uniref:PA14 domain-containing protein n=1 Tax=Mesonia sp. TaxID=1960830 RepID=UPI00175AE8CD|nr:PA14 domain-containing protein [Mesonia sp.]HIB37077.1 hypothetical protein [Mesonia sp.]HIO26722.1 hypothetical protein [Flavobacteriaceae bacterium]
MKKFYIITLILSFTNLINAQVGINTENPEAALDITSSNSGILIPRVALTSKIEAAPVRNPNTQDNNLANGTLVYNTATTTGTNAVQPSFYYWQDTQWVRVNSELDFDRDWAKTNSTSRASNISDNIYTNGKVGIGIGQNQSSLNGTLHIYEATGTPASATNGTIYIEHGNTSGTSSIVFPSAFDPTDYGYIAYSDDGSTGSTNENGLLEIGVANDGATNGNIGDRDNINLKTGNSVGINNTNPSISALLDLGTTNQGLLINRVALTSTVDASTVAGTETDGLLVYNTATAGTSPQNVTEGFYFWDNNQWNRLYSTKDVANTGVQYYSYDITPQASPSINTIRYTETIDKSGYYTGLLNSANAMSTMQPTGVEDGFVIKITGTYEVKTSGTFNFSLNSDDGSRLYIDGSLVVGAWNDSSGNTVSGATNLAKGKHKFEFWFYENSGSQTFSFSWGTNPDGNSGVINAQSFIIE